MAYFECLKSIEDKVVSKSLLVIAAKYSLNKQKNGLNPFPYLEYLFEKLSNIDKIDEKQLSEFLQWPKSIPGYCKNLDKKNK